MENEEKIKQLKYDQNKYDIFFGCVVPGINIQDENPINNEKYLNNDGIELTGITTDTTNREEIPFKCFSINIAKKTDDQNPYILQTEAFGSGNMGYEFDINDRNFTARMAGFHDIGSGKGDQAALEKKQEDINNCGKYYKKEQMFNDDPNCHKYYWNEKKCRTDGIDLRDILVPKMINRLECAENLLRKDSENNILSEKEQNSKEKLNKMTEQLYENSNKDIDKSFTEDEYAKIIEGQNDKDWKEYNEGRQAYILPISRLEIGNNTTNNQKPYVKYYEWNEVDVFKENKEKDNNKHKRVKPKRLFYMPEDHYTDENKENFIKACEKFFPQEQIRIIENDKTKLISIDQFKKDYMQEWKF